MTIGVGGKSKAEALAALSDMTAGVQSITKKEYAARIARAQDYMQSHGIAAMWVHAGTNMTYFTGTKWHPSERMVGAIIPANGAIEYIAPYFEKNTLDDYMVLEGNVNVWHEHESPYKLFVDTLKNMGIVANDGFPVQIAVSEDAPFFIVEGIQQLATAYRLINAKPVTVNCRSRKSPAEIALMQRAKDMTLDVHKAAASILVEGITTTEVNAFIADAHRKVGATGSYFCIVLFGPATAFPHGVKNP